MTESKPDSNYDLFHIGDTVQIIDLQTEKYNEKLAEIRGPYLIDTERWPVQLYHDINQKLAIKSAHLRRVMPISYKPSYSSGVYGGYRINVLSVAMTNKIKQNKDKNGRKMDENKEETKELQRFPVQVFVRMRPLVGLEITESHESIKYNVKNIKKKETETLTLKKVYGRNNERDKKYSGFKQIILPNCDNRSTFNKCLLPTCIPYIFNGENVCVFAYGHTGSGKTHTIFGYRKENVPGMYQLFARHLLNDKRLSNDTFIEIRCTELYQGKIRDLLSNDKAECFLRESNSGEIHIRTQPKKCDDGKIRQYSITGICVQTEQELLNVITDGIASRNVGNSTLHDKSSRSHCFLEFELVSSDLINERKKLVETEADILQLQLIMDSDSLKLLKIKYQKRGQPIPEAKLKRTEMVDGLRNGRSLRELEKEVKSKRKEEKKIKDNLDKLCNNVNTPFIGGTLVFVDLAGNEYGRDVKSKDIEEERERNEINKSLLALKECIRGLHNHNNHIGYRNSKLTMYLKKYLSGKDSKAIMISNIGSSQQYAKHTINTLQYSQLVAKA